MGTQTKYTPQTANTNDKLISLASDNFSKGGYWILANEKDVTIAKQKPGENSEVMINIPKKVFDAFVKFYTEG